MENLRETIKKHNFFYKKKFGQNFISDTNLLDSIVDGAGVDFSSVVVEIGAGGGTLTRALAKKAKKVIAFEIDQGLTGVLSDMTADCKNIELIFEDFLKYDFEQLEKKAGDSYLVVANLPYYITTPIIMRFIEQSKIFSKIIIMVQEEVARRLTAKENTPDYGAITAAIDVCCDTQIIKKVDRRMFYPVPNVDSAVVMITANRAKHSPKDMSVYKAAVKCAFLNRRKTLVNNIMQYFKLGRQAAEKLLTDTGIDLKARGETLSTATFVTLSDNLIEYL